MAKELKFNIGDESFSVSTVKLERKKIYGWTEIKAIDSNGNICRQVGLDSNGVTIIPNGSLKMGMVSEDGKWMDKSELIAIHSDGTKAEIHPSSFDIEINLNTKATEEELLDIIVTSVYVLNGDSSKAFAQKIGNDIYKFPFSYRADYEDTLAFILSNGDSAFIITGQQAKFEFLSMQEQGILNEEEETDGIGFEDLDFGMI